MRVAYPLPRSVILGDILSKLRPAGLFLYLGTLTGAQGLSRAQEKILKCQKTKFIGET